MDSRHKKKSLFILGLFFICFISFSYIYKSESSGIYTLDEKDDNEPFIVDDLVNVKVSKVWTNFTFIHINGNWSNAVSLGWCKGKGTWSEPYILENFTINATHSPIGNGILIENSEYHVIIQNCTVTNVGDDYKYGGIKLYNVSNSIIRDNNCSNNVRSGIFLDTDCNNNTIYNNTISYNEYGINLLRNCNNNTIYNNTLLYNTQNGISLSSCLNNTISGNILEASGIVLTGTDLTHYSSHSIYTTNTLNDKPVYYYANKTDLKKLNFTQDGSAGQVILINCNNSIISDLTLSYGTWGLFLYRSNYNNISDNSMEHNTRYGIIILQSRENLISNNTSIKNGVHGILIGKGFNNSIISNKIISNGYNGIYISKSNITDISSNSVEYNNKSGIFLDLSNNNTIFNNSVSENEMDGISLKAYCFNNTIYNNTINNNEDGIELWKNCHDNKIYNNTIEGNVVHGIILDYNCEKNNLYENRINLNLKYGIEVNCSDYTTIVDNFFYNNQYHGIFSSESLNVKIYGNKFKNCGILLQGTYNHLSSHIIHYNNTVNEKPVYFYVDETNLMSINFTKYGSAGQVLLVNCNNSILSNLNVSNGSNGFFLYQCNNISILNNTANFNVACGIQLEDKCNYINISDNTLENNFYGLLLGNNSDYNNITENSFTRNILYGIFIQNPTCDNNLIFNNAFRENGINAYDNGTNNYWNYTNIGNYWSDYTGRDLDDNGIGDTPYVIPGSAGSIDYAPIWDDGIELSPDLNDNKDKKEEIESFFYVLLFFIILSVVGVSISTLYITHYTKILGGRGKKIKKVSKDKYIDNTRLLEIFSGENILEKIETNKDLRITYISDDFFKKLNYFTWEKQDLEDFIEEMLEFTPEIRMSILDEMIEVTNYVSKKKGKTGR